MEILQCGDCGEVFPVLGRKKVCPFCGSSNVSAQDDQEEYDDVEEGDDSDDDQF